MFQFGKNLNWNDLKQQSEIEQREDKVILKINSITNLVYFPNTPIPFAVKQGTIVPNYTMSKNYNLVHNYIDTKI